MKTFLSFFALALLCFACGSDKPDMSHTAVAGFPTPMYEGMIAAAKGEIMKTIQPNTLVYVQSFTLNLNDKKFIKVFVNDTAGYVPENWLLDKGMLGVVEASQQDTVVIYEDPLQKIPSGITLTETQMIAFKNISGDVSQVVYANEKDSSRPWFGYINHKVISDSTAMNTALLSKDSAPVKAANHIDMVWSDADGNVPAGDSIPGLFALIYVWADDTESEGNHLGDHLEQGVPECVQGQEVKAYKMLFRPNRKMDVTLGASLPSITDQEGPMKVEYLNTEPGKTYEFLITHKVYGVVCDDPTTFFVQTTSGYHGEGKVYASCGD